MNLAFTNGSTRQKELYRFALHNLLNLPFDRIPLSVQVTFKPPEDLGEHGQKNLALTFWNYDSSFSETWVRNDAPGFSDADKGLEALAASLGIKYNPVQHFHETAVHELGHSFFAALPHALRMKVVRMFGGHTDEAEVVNDQDKPWEDRIAEGAAETFKEAFLPRRYRIFPNRTRRVLHYGDYPDFRRIFRGEGDQAAGFNYLYGGGLYEVDLTDCGLPGFTFHKSPHDDEAFVFYENDPKLDDEHTSGWGVDMSQFKESGKLPFEIELEEGIIS